MGAVARVPESAASMPSSGGNELSFFAGFVRNDWSILRKI